MKYEIENELFEKYPGYNRAVLIATGIDNSGEDKELSDILAALEETIRNDSAMDNYKEIPNIKVWRDTFVSMGLNPNKYPPSIANLIKRTSAGKNLPFINKLVCIFNIMSLKYITPCGGDDLDTLKGSIRLGFADGNETYVPLGQPDKLENPSPGEIIYYDTGDGDVFCRGWCWKNGDPSKITENSANVAVNIEGMPPLGKDLLSKIADDMSIMIKKHCGGDTEIHILSVNKPSFETKV